MHVYVQMYTNTTFPLRDESVIGLPSVITVAGSIGLVVAIFYFIYIQRLEKKYEALGGGILITLTLVLSPFYVSMNALTPVGVTAFGSKVYSVPIISTIVTKAAVIISLLVLSMFHCYSIAGYVWNRYRSWHKQKDKTSNSHF